MWSGSNAYRFHLQMWFEPPWEPRKIPQIPGSMGTNSVPSSAFPIAHGYKLSNLSVRLTYHALRSELGANALCWPRLTGPIGGRAGTQFRFLGYLKMTVVFSPPVAIRSELLIHPSLPHPAIWRLWLTCIRSQTHCRIIVQHIRFTAESSSGGSWQLSVGHPTCSSHLSVGGSSLHQIADAWQAYFTLIEKEGVALGVGYGCQRTLSPANLTLPLLVTSSPPRL